MEAVRQTVAQNFGIPGAHEAVPEHQRFSLEDTPDLTDKVAIITGTALSIFNTHTCRPLIARQAVLKASIMPAHIPYSLTT